MGKNLALIEIRSLAVVLLSKYDFAFAALPFRHLWVGATLVASTAISVRSKYLSAGQGWRCDGGLASCLMESGQLHIHFESAKFSRHRGVD